jgi:hypothetical protein
LTRPITELVAEHIRFSARGDFEDSGEHANLILDRIHRGAALDELRPFLDSSDLECRKTLVFVLSEIGTRAAEVVHWIETLLDDPDDFVQFYSILALQHSGSLGSGETVAKAVSKLNQVGPPVLAAVRLLATGSMLQIESSLDFLGGALGESIAWLVGGDWGTWQDLRARGGPGALVSVAVAYRLRGDGDPAPLAKLAVDPEVRVAEAANYIARFRPLPAGSLGLLNRLSASDGE